MQALVSGATYALGPRFSVSAFWTRLASADATVTHLLGAMVNMLWSREPSAGRPRLPRPRRASPASPGGIVERFGLILLEAYGSTETNAVIGRQRDHQRPGYMGKLRRGYHARVADEQDERVPGGRAGELLLREPGAVLRDRLPRHAREDGRVAQPLGPHRGSRRARVG
jgi:crotonobetaine/carnitine-CoA ligase